MHKRALPFWSGDSPWTKGVWIRQLDLAVVLSDYDIDEFSSHDVKSRARDIEN